MLGKLLNDKFGKAYIKNLKASKERRDFITNNFDLIDLKYEIFEAYDGKRFINDQFSIKHGQWNIGYPSSAGFWGNQMSTLHILMREHNDNTESCMIFDDDSYFYNYEKSDEIIETIKTNIPENWDVIIFGGLTNQNFRECEYSYNRVKEHKDCAGSYAVAINKKAYIFLINALNKMEYWGDGIIGHTHDCGGHVYYLEPHICGQNRTLFSDINQRYH